MVTIDSNGKRACLEEVKKKKKVSELLSPGMGRKPEAGELGPLEAGRSHDEGLPERERLIAAGLSEHRGGEN